MALNTATWVPENRRPTSFLTSTEVSAETVAHKTNCECPVIDNHNRTPKLDNWIQLYDTWANQFDHGYLHHPMNLISLTSQLVAVTEAGDEQSWPTKGVNAIVTRLAATLMTLARGTGLLSWRPVQRWFATPPSPVVRSAAPAVQMATLYRIWDVSSPDG